MLLLQLLACGSISAGNPAPGAGDPADAPENTDGEGSQEEYIAEEDPIEPSLTLKQVSASVAIALASTHAVDAGLLYDAYDAAMAPRTATCPYTNEDYRTYYGYD